MINNFVTEATDKYDVDLEQALVISGIGWYNMKYCLILTLVLISVITEGVGYSYVLPAGKCDLNISDAQRGFIASEPYIGIIITSFVWGYLADTRGRRLVTVYSTLIAGIFAMLSAFMPELFSLMFCKFLTALCVAGPACIPYAFIAELLPHRHRDLILSVVNALQITGSVAVPLMAWAILPLNFSIDLGIINFRPWRLLAMANSSCFLISSVLMYFGPESPKYLIARGRHDEALQILQTIYAGNKKKAPEDYPVKSLKLIENTIVADPKGGLFQNVKSQTMPLFKPPYLKWLLLNGCLLFGTFATLNGLYVWIPDILNRLVSGHQNDMVPCDIISLREETKKHCDDNIDTSIFIINVIALASCAVVALFSSYIVELIGKKTLLVTLFFLIGISSAMLNVVNNRIMIILILSAYPVMTLAIGPINAFAVEMFPTQLRGMAICLTMMIGRIGSVIGANVVGILMSNECRTTFNFFGGLLISCGFLTFFLPRPKEVGR